MAGSPEKSRSSDGSLQEIPQDLADWAGGEIPPGWEPIAELCRRIHGRFAATVDLIVDRIIEEVPFYQGDTPIGRDDIRVSVGANLDMMLRGIATHRGPRPAELAERRELGTERATQGVPVTALLEAFVVGYRVIWDELVRATRVEDQAVRELLLTAAATVWLWVHEVVDEVGTAYHERTRRGVALVSAVRERFFNALLGQRYDPVEVAELAKTLGFDPERTFTASACVADADTDAEDLLDARFRATPGRHHFVRRGAELLALHQGAAPVGIEGAAIAVGTPRDGLAGAAASLEDARLALALSVRSGRPTDFTHDWHAATLLASEHRLQPLLAPGIEAARQSPDLAETVRVFAASAFSMSETSRRMHLHTNTVAYRLARWHDLTGWNPRTFDGLARTMTALAVIGDSSAS